MRFVAELRSLALLQLVEAVRFSLEDGPSEIRISSSDLELCTAAGLYATLNNLHALATFASRNAFVNSTS